MENKILMNSWTRTGLALVLGFSIGTFISFVNGRDFVSALQADFGFALLGWLHHRGFVLRNGCRPRKGVSGLVRLLAGALSEYCRITDSRPFTYAYTYN